jgi:O-acetyl-ADP-ribose deacetylase (regulator of RNase III)
MYKEIEGDLIDLAFQGKFDVITHGCNCFCVMGAGIAIQMKQHFNCNTYPLENIVYRGDINKLGQIEGKFIPNLELVVINSYTQYFYNAYEPMFDYEAFALCMRKINRLYTGKQIGLPQIGAGLAKGDWNIIKEIIKKELSGCHVTVVIYNK